MNSDIQELLDRFNGLSQWGELSDLMHGPSRARVHVKGAAGSFSSFLVASFLQRMDSGNVVVLPDRESAAYFYNDIVNILGEGKVLYFPSSLKKPYGFPQADNTNILMRAEVLTNLKKNSSAIPVVTYAEALHEKVVTRQTLDSNTVEARVGEKLSVDFIMEFLTEHGFEREDFIYEAGQFSIRGGIVDIFSFSHELPYRLEFSGEEIESIREFDPLTQLSTRAMNHISIIPNVQQKMIQEQKQSFMDYLSDDTVIWGYDLELSAQSMNDGLDRMMSRSPHDSGEEELYDIVKGDPKEVFDTAAVILDGLKRLRVIEFGTRFHFPATGTIEFDSRPQPVFNKNFEILGNTMLQNTANNIETLIFSDTSKQIERIYAIFEDIELKDRKPGQQVDFKPIRLSVHEGFISNDLKLACYTDHQIFNRYHRYRIKRNYGRSEAMTLKELYGLKPGDFVVHIDHGVGKFAGLEKLDVNGKHQEAIRLVYKDNDILYVSIHSLHRITRFTGKEGTQPKLNKLGTQAWNNLKQKTKKKVKDIARDLIDLYAKRKAQKGFAFTPDTYIQNELEASFIYEDTPDQVKATADVKQDMERSYPMDRLICGDVGFGKTEVAVRAAFKACADGKQVAVLVPTTILALQHFRTFSERLKDFPVTVDYLNRFKSAAQQTDTRKRLETGKIDIIIGTHRLLSKDIKFMDLGLLIVDEEQKFGVASKEKLKALRVNVDTLTLTATPIPRTLQFSLMGARDLSIINTPPPNRYPVTTELHIFNEDIIREAIMFEVSRGGQVFFVHNRVRDIHEVANMIRRLCPGVTMAVGHGQMDGDQLEKVLLSFIEGETDVLISTTIIESGLDISNANTMIINQAHHFGLSDLHQMRGRVGRSNTKAFCYLLSPPLTVLTPEARQRLKAIEEFSDLGSGFAIAMRDLDIRGAGNLLGGEQSGFISEIGYEMYHKILDEAMRELKESDYKDLFTEEETPDISSDCQIDTDLELLIPTAYVTSITERLSIYKELDDVDEEETLNNFSEGLRDRFGPIPEQVRELMNAIRLRWVAKRVGFEKITLKAGSMKGTFISDPGSEFYRSDLFAYMIRYVQKNASETKLVEKKSRLSITFFRVRSVAEARNVLEKIEQEYLEEAAIGQESDSSSSPV
jgi:transcription-repair coupling factor (superfamily II helicase)